MGDVKKKKKKKKKQAMNLYSWLSEATRPELEELEFLLRKQCS